MTQHDHRTFVEGCYRCDLSRDEVEQVDLDELEALAKVATPGPWGLYLGAAWQVITDAPDWEQREVATTGPDGSTGSEDDAAFIAAADPSTVIALIAELRQERERADDLETRLSEYLCDSTGGLLSKTGYDVRTMVAHTEDYYNEIARDELAPVEAALSRAEETIADALAWMDAGAGRLGHHPLRRILNDYKQKGNET